MGTFAGFGPVHPDIAWAKLRSLSQGAELSAIRLAKGAARLRKARAHPELALDTR
jgi:hypothetical protein